MTDIMTHKEQATTASLSETERAARVRLQTFRRSYAQILAGEGPWIALGNFLHQFFGAYKHLRPLLVRDSPQVPKQPTPEQFRWAVFCAASADYLCKQYDLPCPAWAHHSRFTLSEPWYCGINAHLPEVQEDLRHTTPEEFSKRNIFCGDRTFRNKYEHEGRQGRRRTA